VELNILLVAGDDPEATRFTLQGASPRVRVWIGRRFCRAVPVYHRHILVRFGGRKRRQRKHPQQQQIANSPHLPSSVLNCGRAFAERSHARTDPLAADAAWLSRKALSCESANAPTAISTSRTAKS